MKTIVLYLLILLPAVGFGQDNILSKGSTVYIEAPKSDVGKSAAAELKTALADWGYWKIASSRQGADYVMKLESKISGGVTWTSWGGKSVALSASVLDKGNEEVWQSESYKASPNGSNGFNSQSAAVKKLVKGLKRRFQ